jgi:hypothetical protein
MPARDTPALVRRPELQDPDEIAEQRDGVSVTIHTDPRLPFGKAFVEAMQPIVDECLAARPMIEPARPAIPSPDD